ncbi:MAG: alpha/beta fold hydrolase [Verrucomicrobiae bacterium]|nr:alpha/beta fold hydrolase [Verrucomicrobiae bacterium]
MPKKEVIIIHGGSCWKTRAEYLTDLRATKFVVGFFPRAGWHTNLQKDLGAGFKVWLPDMPNWQNSRYDEWKIWFEKALAVAGASPVVVGHSLGGIFLIKYFSETVNPPKTRAILLVGTPYKTVSENPDFGNFALKRAPRRLDRLGANLHFYHSQDDSIVNFADVEKYQKVLPRAAIKKYTDRGHFIQNHFPDLVQDVKTLFNSR